MLYIRTGKPGHGKTLNTIREVDQKAHAEGRVVYFHNINGLKPDQLKASWFKFDEPEKWFELPNDSIIVIDEAQGWFGARDPRARPPEHITRFETMRHQGHEVHLVTQDPRYLDVHLRRLCNGHIHYWRVFKSQQLLRFESEVVVEKVEVKSSFKDADKKTLRLDQKYFGVYTSTNAAHHFQAKVPTKFLLALAVILVASFLVYRAYERYEQGKLESEAATSALQAEAGVVDQVKSTMGNLINPTGDGEEKPLTPEQYVGKRVPRIADIPASAPIYDKLTTPVTHPRVYCLSTRDLGLIARRPPETVRDGVSCQCYTQQATKFATSFDFCMTASRDGYFDPTIPDRSSNTGRQLAGAPPPSPSYAPQDSPQTAPDGLNSSRLTVIEHKKERFLW